MRDLDLATLKFRKKGYVDLLRHSHVHVSVLNCILTANSVITQTMEALENDKTAWSGNIINFPTFSFSELLILSLALKPNRKNVD